MLAKLEKMGLKFVLNQDWQEIGRIGFSLCFYVIEFM